MITTVIIPAFNEERNIALTLSSLPREGIRPTVALNGTSDNTENIAIGFGVEVVETTEQGKLLAIQRVLKILGQDALNPIIILDADTKPIFRNLWARNMVKGLRPETNSPSATGGPVVFTNGKITEDSILTFRRARRTLKNDEVRLPQNGPNMSLYLQNSNVLDSILSLPNYWPGEDQAMNQVVLDHNGNYTASLNLSILASTPSSESYLSSRDRKQLGLENARARVLEAYVSRGPKNTNPYNPFREF